MKTTKDMMDDLVTILGPDGMGLNVPRVVAKTGEAVAGLLNNISAEETTEFVLALPAVTGINVAILIKEVGVSEAAAAPRAVLSCLEALVNFLHPGIDNAELHRLMADHAAEIWRIANERMKESNPDAH